MQAPCAPSDEAARLSALYDYQILDSGSEQAFDALARLAAHVVDTPIALISLVDAERQWFKARVGLDVEGTPRDVSFCAHVVATGRPLLVPDAHCDPRFCDNPLVLGEPGVVFYLGVPLKTEDGRVLGSLCAIDRRPRQADGAQLELLELLAGQVMAQLDLRRQNLSLAKQRAETEVYRRFFELSPDLLCTADKAMRLVHVNPAWEAALGYPLGALRGLCAIELIHPDDRPVVLAAASEANDKPYLALEMRMVSREGEVIPFSWVSVGTDDLYFAAARNIRERVEADRLKADFISTVNHELRTPLTAIRGALGLVDAGVTGSLPEEAAGCVRVALRGAERLTRLIHDILDLERVASGRIAYSLEAVDLHEACRRALNTAEPYATSHGVDLRLQEQSEPVLAWADEDRVQQVLANLLSNAVKFSPPESEVMLSVSAGPGYAHVSVRDRGGGVPRAFQRRLFQRFAQADASNARAAEGSGLGLAICKELLEAMGGRISYTDAPGGGSCFTVTLPVALAV